MHDKDAEEAKGYGAQPPPPLATTLMSSSHFLTANLWFLLNAGSAVLHISHQPLGTAP